MQNKSKLATNLLYILKAYFSLFPVFDIYVDENHHF